MIMELPDSVIGPCDGQVVGVSERVGVGVLVGVLVMVGVNVLVGVSVLVGVCDGVLVNTRVGEGV
jgi:hypothetical protein